LYQREIGGLSRAGTVLDELVEAMDFDKITTDFLRLFPAPAIQRMGYLLDEALGHSDKAKILLEKVKQAEIQFRKTWLKPEIQSGELSEYEQNEIWKIIINEEIEIDD
jgi:predicted transcriptional regulator of viral defense system